MQLGRISFGPVYPSTLGFDKIFSSLEHLATSSTKDSKNNISFPPHNIILVDENVYIVEVAVAGFSEEDINITVTDGNLIISGTKHKEPKDVTYLHHGISTRAFTKTIHLAETIQVTGADYFDGILHVHLQNVVPEKKTQIVNVVKRKQLLTE